MSKSWPTPSANTPPYAEESGAVLNALDYEVSPSEPFLPRLARHWHLMVLPGLMGLMIWMVGALLWPQPRAEIILKPLQASALTDAYPVPAEEISAPEEEIGEEVTTASENDAETGSETASATKTARKKRAHAYPKKSAHPPVTNLNRASLDQLQGLPGIGPKMAQRIVEYRKVHGAFASPEQVMDVKGIGPKKFEKLKPFLKV